jgi:hypothetical protein
VSVDADVNGLILLLYQLFDKLSFEDDPIIVGDAVELPRLTRLRLGR